MTNRLLPVAAFLILAIQACAPPVQLVQVTNAPVRQAPNVVQEVAAVEAPVNPYEGVETGRFDTGKMWTFDHPPIDYFRGEYDIAADSVWFAKARAASLRFSSYCSASFVSPDGLVMTNHHCARESVTEVSGEDEALLENGFVAKDRSEERKVEDLFVDKLEAIRDVTAQIYEADRMDMPEGARAADRDRRATDLGTRLTRELEAEDSTRFVEVVPLYNGAQYAAYTFKRYKDIRLVMAPELQIGFYGGDEDNFTYPRYNLDAAFFRAYDASGNPVKPEHYFSWSASGATEGDAVFVVGNGGSTSRLNTVSQLEYLRDDELPVTVKLLERRTEVFGGYIAEHPEDVEPFDLENAHFSIQNNLKSLKGQLAGLESDWLIPRRGAAEWALREEIAASDSLSKAYRGLFDEIDAVQGSKRASLGTAGAFAYFLHPAMGSRILGRAMYGYVYTLVRQRGAPPEQRKEIRDEALEIESFPPELEKQLIALRIEEIERALGPSDASVKRLLGGRTAWEVASMLVDSTALGDSTAFRKLLDENYLNSGDASVAAIEVIGPLYFTQSQQLSSFEERETGLNARLGRARFAVYGRDVAPDATFSPRISDGRVLGYESSGVPVAPFTTYYGLYGRYTALGHDSRWALPERWVDPPESLDLSVPLNLVTTNDITGGNSGSPLVNSNLEIVGLIFDSNIEALPNEFLYTDVEARAVSVDSRGIIEALEEIYGAGWLAAELTGSGAATGSGSPVDD
ncbi:MAG: S46 family peptidase [Rhodothermales bacterium]|nr:S46 family peptidase [Rhodothermales bacterium]